MSSNDVILSAILDSPFWISLFCYYTYGPYEMYRFVNYRNLMKKTGKIQNYVKKVDFWLNVREICGRHGHGKNDGRTIDISKIYAQHECMSEQLLKVSVP